LPELLHRARKPWARPRSRLQVAALASACALLSAALLAHGWLDNQDEPVLLTLPIVLAAIAAGPVGGYIAATVAVAAYLAWMPIDVATSTVHLGVRIAALYLAGGLVGHLVGRLRRASGDRDWLLEQGNTGLVELDARGRITSLNSPAKRQLAADGADLVGKSMDSVLPGLPIESGIAGLVVNGAGGASTPIDVAVTRRRAASTVAIRDLTDHHRADTARRQSHARGRALRAVSESEERFRGAVETMLDSFGIFAALRGTDGEVVDFTCTYANHAAEREAGPADGGPRGRRLGELWPGGEARALETYRRVVETGEPAQVDVQRTDPGSGETKTFEVHAVKFGDGYAATWCDITDRVRMQAEITASSQELARSNAALEEFARVVSHDLSEPLWTASLYAQALDAHGAHLGRGGHELVVQMTQAIELMQERIHDLLFHARVRGDASRLELVDTRHAVREAQHALAASIGAASAVLEIGPLPSIVTDRMHVRQLFQNLISNAIKYARDGVPPLISISASPEDGAWHFAISDNGIGVDADDRERIFEVFQRAHGSDRPGTGIGLAVCRKIVELQGGRIWAAPHDGPGTTLHFTVPNEP
jgi:nitrogen fixation/metabolism regulation signal transduction histidine kinase